MPPKRPWFGKRLWQYWRLLCSYRSTLSKNKNKKGRGVDARLTQLSRQKEQIEGKLQAARTVFSKPETHLTQTWQANAFTQSTQHTRSILHQGLLKALPLWQKNRKQALKAMEESLLMADVGLQTTKALLKPLQGNLASTSSQAMEEGLRQTLHHVFTQAFKPLHLPPALLQKRVDGTKEVALSTPVSPSVWVFLGVNGVGKTTSIGKVAFQLHHAGFSVMLVAADSFRAAATEQLRVWAQRVGCELYTGEHKASPSQVLYQGIEQAKAQGIQLVLCDTAGRLHTNYNLMQELAGVCRAAQKAHAGAPHEKLLVVDANTGQNALRQAKRFHEVVGLTGVLATKLEGSAKGGVLVALVNEFGLPIRWVGMGEGIEDLHPFDAKHFVAGLLRQG